MTRVRICIAAALLAATSASVAGIGVADASASTPNASVPMADLCMQPPTGPLVCLPFVANVA